MRKDRVAALLFSGIDSLMGSAGHGGQIKDAKPFEENILMSF